MPTNKNGKRFERAFKDACINDKIFCLRLNDSDVSYQTENSDTRFSPKNKADFICFHKGILLPVECKSTKYSSLSIQRSEKEPKKMIKAHQIKDLIELSQYEGVQPGFVLNFREEDENNNPIGDTTYWLSIQNFSNFLYENDKNSINRLDVINYGGLIIENRKLRKYYTYKIRDFFDKIVNNIHEQIEQGEE